MQRGQVCEALTARLPRGPYWAAEKIGGPRPTERACDVREGLARLSESERVLVLVAWDAWNGGGETSLERILHSLDRNNLTMVGSLLVAIAAPSSVAVDEWLARYAPAREEIAS